MVYLIGLERDGLAVHEDGKVIDIGLV